MICESVMVVTVYEGDDVDQDEENAVQIGTSETQVDLQLESCTQQGGDLIDLIRPIS